MVKSLYKNYNNEFKDENFPTLKYTSNFSHTAKSTINSTLNVNGIDHTKTLQSPNVTQNIEAATFKNI